MRVATFAMAVSFFLVGLAAASDGEAAIRRFTNIPPQGLRSALQALSKEREFQVVFRTDLVGDAHTAGAAGDLTLDEALTVLLKGTGLTYRYLDEMTITVLPIGSEKTPRASTQVQVDGTGGASSAPEEGAKSIWNRFRMAQVDQGASGSDPEVEKKGEQASNMKPIQLEEVIVTATKREERLQDVPMSLAVINNEEIERRGLMGMEDYLRSIPGVNQIDDGPISNAIVMRGITTSPEFENFSSGTTVATYFGETPITGAGGLGAGGIDVRPVDLSRIEVLRGPQGTTFGDASLGGTLRLIPVAPNLHDFSAKVVGDYSNTSGSGSDNTMVQGILNIPLVANQFALRAVAYRYEDSGFYRNVAGSDPATLAIFRNYGLVDELSGYKQDNVGGIVTTGARAAALWQPSDKLNVTLTYLTQTIEQDGSPNSSVGTYEQAFAPIAPPARVRGQFGEAADTDIHLASALLNYELGWAALTTTFSWINGGSQFARDYSPFFLFPASDGGVSHFRSFTGEARLASHLQGPFHFLGGLFYERVNNAYFQTYDWDGSDVSSPFGPNPIFEYNEARRLDQRAVFGEISYDLTEKLRATAGGRYFKYENDDEILEEGFFAGVPLGAGIPENLEGGENHSTFKAGLSYKPTQDSLLYALWSQGFRLGYPQVGLPVSCADSNGDIVGTDVPIATTRTVNSDNLDNYEAGGKFTFSDRRITVDFDVYHINWNGLPVRVPSPAAGCPGYTANAGAATSDGLEVQTSVLVGKGLRVDLGGGYSNAKLSKDAPGLIPPAFKGDRLPGAPRANASVAAQYEFDLLGQRAFVRADSFYTGAFYGDFQQSSQTKAGDYVYIGGRAGVAVSNLSVEVFVRNLTNKNAYTWRGLTNTNAFYGYQLQPRTLGVQLGYNFH